ncbi:MAG TPA: Holliday junction branch migration protein RuvA [Nocardioidaceae bacterium]|nr:Holliday junction branch migration protein RuvA [Nocardioidaceae bacterium]
MIAFVRGTVADVTLDSVVLEVGGVGLQLHCTPPTLATLHVGAPATLPTSMVVREESLTLFGFLDEEEKALFELLQTASGVGPRLAQAMLAVLTPDELRRAVAGEDVRALTAVPGIGQKGAQRIILELKDRIGVVGTAGGSRPALPRSPQDGWRSQVHAGLVGLGWSAKEADRAVETVAPEAERADGSAPEVASLLRAALRSLSSA